MEAAVTTVLAECFSQPTAWDAFEAWCSLPGFKPSRRTASQAAGGPHRRRNLWQPQVAISISPVSLLTARFTLMDVFCQVGLHRSSVARRIV